MLRESERRELGVAGISPVRWSKPARTHTQKHTPVERQGGCAGDHGRRGAGMAGWQIQVER